MSFLPACSSNKVPDKQDNEQSAGEKESIVADDGAEPGYDPITGDVIAGQTEDFAGVLNFLIWVNNYS